MVNPILVQAIRGELIESCYRGAYVVVDIEGNIIVSAGDNKAKIYPRSALKPIQSLAVVESGAANKFNLSSEELALACASHNGEEQHVKLTGT